MDSISASKELCTLNEERKRARVERWEIQGVRYDSLREIGYDRLKALEASYECVLVGNLKQLGTHRDHHGSYIL
jgi:hypothetical protein